jgi:hypothetical protein
VDFFYYTKRKKKKLIFLQQQETDALKWAANITHSSQGDGAIHIFKLLEDKYDISSIEIDDAPVCKRIKGYPVQPF